MTINQTKIDNAKTRSYNLRNLTDPEKTIFDGLDENVVAKIEGILDSVLKVKDGTTTTFDSALLTNLYKLRWQSKSTDDRKAYEAMNKDSNLVKNVIAKLESFTDKPTAVTWAKAYFPSDGAVFDYRSLGTASKVYEAARILNYVKWADDSNNNDQKTHIKGRLESAKVTFADAYNAVNSIIGQADSAIIKVSGGKPNDNLANLQVQLLAAQNDISKKEKELEELELETTNFKTEYTRLISDQQQKKENLVKYKKALLILQKNLVPAVGEPFANDVAFNAINRADNDVDITTALAFLDDNSAPSLNGSLIKLNEYYYTRNKSYAEHKITYGTPGRKYMTKGAFEAIMLQINYFFFKALDKNALFESIDKSPIISVSGSNGQTIGENSKERAKYLFEKIIKLDFHPEKYKIPSGTGYGILGLEFSQKDSNTREVYIDSIIADNPAIRNRKRTMDYLESLPEAVDYKEIFEFMNIVFPVGTSMGSLSTNPILLASSNCYFNSPPGRTWSFKWNAKSEIPATNQQMSWIKWAEINKPKLLITEKTPDITPQLGFSQVIEFFHNAFPPTTIQTPAVWDDGEFMSGRDADILTYRRAKQFVDQIHTTLSKSFNGCKAVVEDRQLTWDLMVHLVGQYIEKRKAAKNYFDYFTDNLDKMLSLNILSDHLAPLRTRINTLEWETNYSGGELTFVEDDMKEARKAENLKKKEIRDAKKREESIQKQIDALQGNDVEDLKKKFWAVYRAPVVASPEKYDENQLDEMEACGSQIVRLDITVMESDTVLKTAYDKIVNLRAEVLGIKGLIANWFKLSTKSQAERFKAATRLEIEKAQANFEALEAKVKMSESWEDELDAIKKELATPTKDPVSDLDISKLKDALGLTSDPDKELVDKWKNLDGNTKLKTQADLKKFIGKYVRVDNRASFVKHLESLTGADAVNAATENEKLEIFLKRDPKKVIETIVDHILETPDEKTRITNAFKAAKDSTTGKGLDMSKYDSASTQEKPSEKAIKVFAYEEIIGKAYSYQPKDQQEVPEGNKKGWFEKYVADYWYAPIWVPILLTGLAIFYFWDNIANWWNGPAEEETVEKDNE